MTQNPDTLITTKQAAELLAIRPNTLATWRSENRSPVPHVQVGARAVRYRLGDVWAYIRSQSEKGQGVA